MKARRTFQIASGLLAVLFALAILFAGVMIGLAIFEQFKSGGLPHFFDTFTNWGDKINTVARKIPFLPDSGPIGGATVVGVIFGAPTLLLALAAICLLTKSKKGKEGAHTFGAALGIIGTALFVGCIELLALLKSVNMFDGDKWTYVIAVGATGFVLLLMLILSMLGKKKQPVAEQQPEEAAEQPTEEQPETATNEQEPTDSEYTVAQPYAQPQYDDEWRETTETQPQYDYTQYDTRTVRDIMDHTYGAAPIENVGKDNMKKIQTLQSLYEAKAITKDEYLALVQAYLKSNRK